MDYQYSEIESQLIILMRQFLLEQNMERAVHAVTLNASLDRELGIDSLGKVEFFHRVEKLLGKKFTTKAMAQADCLKDIAKLSLTAKISKKYTKHVVNFNFKSTEVNLTNIQSLQQVLLQYVINNPERPHIYLQHDDGAEEIITYGMLWSEATKIANSLLSLGIQSQDIVALMLPTDKHFFAAFFGILLAGAIPAPIYPPFRIDRLEEYISREINILNNAEVRILITFAKAQTLSNVLKTSVPSLKKVVTVTTLLNDKKKYHKQLGNKEDAALIQYTSGSTGDPKGVLLLHKNILANIQAAGKGLEITANDVMVSWLPLYHDMGLMSWLGSLYFGLPLVIMSPLSFLNHPEQWLWAIHYYRGTISAAPNFAYELCNKKIDPSLLVGLDLSSWRLALNGAEAINPATLAVFYQTFKKYGFKETALFPVYGLAENTVGLTLPKPGAVPKIDRICKDTFERQSHAVSSCSNKNYLEFVCVGKAISDHEIRIVNDQDQALNDREIGHIQFRGPSAMGGYYRNSIATNAIFHHGWWDTGDLGYLALDELYITGRKKDLIIKAGRNFYPETFEKVVGEINGIRKGCVAAFGVTDSKLGTEKIVIVAETKLTDKIQKTHLQQTIVEQVASAAGIPPDEIVLVSPQTIPKTSSGKLQRSNCKQHYLAGKLSKKAQPLSFMLIKLFFKTIALYCVRLATNMAKFFYSLYAAIIFIVTLIPVALILMVLPAKPAAYSIKFWARNFFRLIFCPVNVKYQSDINLNQPLIYTPNHCSYSDALLLIATLPPQSLFVAKKELLKVPLLAIALKKLGYIVLDRSDFSQNLADMKYMEVKLKEKKSLVIFPEGTFTYASGLRAFKTGAFQLAAKMDTPICAVALRGTRKFMRGHNFLLRPQKLTITFIQVLVPQSDEWHEIIRLRTETRKLIAAYCGEPTVNLITAGAERKS